MNARSTHQNPHAQPIAQDYQRVLFVDLGAGQTCAQRTGTERKLAVAKHRKLKRRVNPAFSALK